MRPPHGQIHVPNGRSQTASVALPRGPLRGKANCPRLRPCAPFPTADRLTPSLPDRLALGYTTPSIQGGTSDVRRSVRRGHSRVGRSGPEELGRAVALGPGASAHGHGRRAPRDGQRLCLSESVRSGSRQRPPSGEPGGPHSTTRFRRLDHHPGPEKDHALIRARTAPPRPAQE